MGTPGNNLKKANGNFARERKLQAKIKD